MPKKKHHKKKHHIRLSAEERGQLETIVRKGKASAHRQRHARILLLADTHGPEGGWSDSRIADAAHTSIPTVDAGAAHLCGARVGAGA